MVDWGYDATIRTGNWQLRGKSQSSQPGPVSHNPNPIIAKFHSSIQKQDNLYYYCKNALDKLVLASNSHIKFIFI